MCGEEEREGGRQLLLVDVGVGTICAHLWKLLRLYCVCALQVLCEWLRARDKTVCCTVLTVDAVHCCTLPLLYDVCLHVCPQS